ncbi:MAG: TetR/AcrR family transcriptional regulator [Crocinitomicaceae bacterium]|nr:TetR/AcrR family transcriptional regulator [Crocinitomicaceae bacterium]
MGRKAENTSLFILSKVAPLFNKNGYEGTSLSELERATGMTKGAIYGNFKNKQELAFSAFKYNVDRVVGKIREELEHIKSPVEQLLGLSDFYKRYKSYTIEFGGCPLLNIGVDAKHQNPILLKRVQDVILKLQGYIEKMIRNGQDMNEIKADIDPELYAKRIFTLIEGSIFMTVTMNDETYLTETMTHIDGLILNELKA